MTNLRLPLAPMIAACAAIWMLGFASALAQASNNLASIVDAYAADNRFMGAVLVASGDKILIDKGYGQADLEWNLPNAPDVKFDIGSLSKQFTAALVLLLQDDGLLKLDDPVGKYLNDVPEAWRPITLAQLLGNTSGLPDLWSDKGFNAWSMSPRTPREVLERFYQTPLLAQPGAEYRYSSTGYILVGLVIEKVSGKAYGDLLRQRIFEPLKMKDSGLDADALVLARRARGYTLREGALVRERPMSMEVGWAAGAIYSTTHDLLRWEQGLYGGRLLSPESLKAMTTAGKGDYGLGINVAKVGELTSYRHLGAFQGFHATLTWLPERRIAVVVLGNVAPPRPVVAAMTDQLLAATLSGKPVGR